MNVGKKYAKTQQGAQQALRRQYTSKPCGRDSELRLSSRPSLCKRTSQCKKATEFNSPNVQYIFLGHSRRQSGNFNFSGKPLSKMKTGCSEMLSPTHSILSKFYQASVHVFRLSSVWENTRDERRNRQVDHEVDTSSTTWRDDYLERNQFEIPRLRVPR